MQLIFDEYQSWTFPNMFGILDLKDGLSEITSITRQSYYSGGAFANREAL